MDISLQWTDGKKINRQFDIVYWSSKYILLNKYFRIYHNTFIFIKSLDNIYYK